ncbi:cupin domain-containing protein [Shewanella submarina]|uniref:Cupin domain-containing protein n=1 Tax=Shewanella submarina TaxID=2016376 RepID=A0ABV7GHW5_9GAMM|nr:cupin domain-containing protein [Shewanella submarina]MCL1038207.1 cupin domain-containing protein [Shewanella submarina]
MDKHNIYQNLPDNFEHEEFSDLLSLPGIRIERIVSKGHSSPDVGWYEQDENEWVMVLKGAGVLEFEDGREVHLNDGDYLNIPKRVKHKVKWTDPDTPTLWLAVFYP